MLLKQVIVSGYRNKSSAVLNNLPVALCGNPQRTP